VPQFYQALRTAVETGTDVVLPDDMSADELADTLQEAVIIYELLAGQKLIVPARFLLAIVAGLMTLVCPEHSEAIKVIELATLRGLIDIDARRAQATKH
jgi:hypothetical protein